MAPSPLQQRRTHNSLLFQKLLNLRDSASPFTLILDTLEQTGAPVVREFARRAKISKSKIIYISFSTIPKKVPFDVDTFVAAKGKCLSALRTEILTHLPGPSNAASLHAAKTARYLLIIDNVHSLSSGSNAQHLSSFLSSLLVSPQMSLLATYHTDVPLHSTTSYTPLALTTLTYLATAILTVSSLAHVLARKRARDRSLQEPVFGLQEDREGVIVGFNGKKNTGDDESGVVINMEMRRRSGRGVVENFVLCPEMTPSDLRTKLGGLGVLTLLDDHPLYASIPSAREVGGQGEAEVESTFSLGLTEKQKRDREGVILPYFDAQKDGGAAGPGEGGRILYDMGAEDREDFDDEEDEI